jgi:hypothetical protein
MFGDVQMHRRGTPGVHTRALVTNGPRRVHARLRALSLTCVHAVLAQAMVGDSCMRACPRVCSNLACTLVCIFKGAEFHTNACICFLCAFNYDACMRAARV